ncbi:MAG: Crp/Fnr family transcriptional regulator [Bosea sp.]|uniref:Crp/Fnr family transcriptional regulator n=1 Tax=Bosea sp. (in: a-proteobacteria) TaxID=1871050 RepID=UPI0023A73017|nr:Crp/Fnr family transcriptional regulator [Bosea sp. (in: a-proteobacteria)]MCP4739905.1 Crp/Fnr family transcriptional regulator [Bosea sp. (in: a-proteobacteria)]
MGAFSEVDPVIRRLGAGETLFAAGDVTRGFFGVREGRVRLVRFGIDGRETALFTAGPGERFAEASLFAERYHCDAIALSEAVVECYPKAACLAQLGDDATARLDLTADLARQVMRLRARLTQRDIRSARDRVPAFLVAEAGDDGRTVAFDGPLREIAGAIGLTPEACYRTLARLEAQGMIAREAGRIVLT